MAVLFGGVFEIVAGLGGSRIRFTPGLRAGVTIALNSARGFHRAAALVVLLGRLFPAQDFLPCE